ncbi:MAG: AEC family transporter [Chloroflexi bacterium]|mgnify:CR=1 FL=1|jgi:predicted permease|nr:AEC family transporter [Chloroflexota bacterium]
MVLSSLFPVFGLILLGNLLKRFKLTDESFLKTSDRLVYFVLFPVLLFWKIGGAQTDSSVNWDLCLCALLAIAAIYLISAVGIKVSKVSNYKAGSFSQSCYRFNTFIGMAIVFYALGDDGVKHFGILIGCVIPFINVLAVSTLIWHSGGHYSFWERSQLATKAIISNPLIIACIAGIVYSRSMNGFPTAIENGFSLSASVALPLALISVGGALTFKSFKGNFRLSLVASILKLLFLPIIGYAFLKAFNVTGIHFDVGIIFFALPTSAAIYVLSSQLHSDTELASASIVLSTILSFFSLSVGLLFL